MIIPGNYAWEGQGAIYNQRENMNEDEAPRNHECEGIMDEKGRAKSKIEKKIWMGHPSMISQELWMGAI